MPSSQTQGRTTSPHHPLQGKPAPTAYSMFILPLFVLYVNRILCSPFGKCSYIWGGGHAERKSFLVLTLPQFIHLFYCGWTFELFPAWSNNVASAFVPGLHKKSQLLSGDAGHKESRSFTQATSWRTCDASASGKNLGPDREQGHGDPALTVCKADGGADRQNTERGGLGQGWRGTQ